ncbi:MAG: hypothetical protein JWN78_2615 [Bacteroidota bacterium]|nr:hypothetical protein [Bacteroidota bacterium]
MKNKIYTILGICLVCANIFTACKSSDNSKVGNETSDKKDTTINEILEPQPVPEKDTTAEVKPSTETSDTTKKADAKIVPLTVSIGNLKSPSAPVIVSFYTPQNKFLDLYDQKKYQFKPKNGKLSEKITDLPYGVYAIAIFEDLNSDGKIDKNMLGIPTEPYAFSQNYKPKIHAPSFDDCKFTYNAKENSVKMTLLH